MTKRTTTLRALLVLGAAAGALTFTAPAHAAVFKCEELKTVPNGGYYDPATGAWIDEFYSYCVAWTISSNNDTTGGGTTPGDGTSGGVGLGAGDPMSCADSKLLLGELAAQRAKDVGERDFAINQVFINQPIATTRAVELGNAVAAESAAMGAQDAAIAAYALAYGGTDLDGGAGRPIHTVPVLSRISRSTPEGQRVWDTVAAYDVAHAATQVALQRSLVPEMELAIARKDIAKNNQEIAVIDGQVTATNRQRAARRCR